MTAYAQRLNQEADRAAAAHKAAKESARLAEVEAVREKMVPLETRLRRLLDTIPIELQREGLQLEFLRTRLRSVWHDNQTAQAGQLGTALKRLGFERRRIFRAKAWQPTFWILVK